MTGILPELNDTFGSQLEVVILDINLPDGKSLFLAAIEAYAVPSSVVPLMIVGDTYLLGTASIEDQVHELIDFHLSQGGAEFPAIPGLSAVVDSLLETQAVSSAQPSPSAASTPTRNAIIPTPGIGQDPNPLPSDSPILNIPGFSEHLRQDPVGYPIGMLILAGMILSLVLGTWMFVKGRQRVIHKPVSWIIPILCIAGFIIAGYLFFKDTRDMDVFCDGVGDCQAVQHSQYSRLYGFMPVSAIGMLGYMFLLGLWILSIRSKDRLLQMASLAMPVLAVCGLLFSIWLTWLELYVIGAVCAWCLASAVVISLLFFTSIAQGSVSRQ